MSEPLHVELTRLRTENEQLHTEIAILRTTEADEIERLRALLERAYQTAAMHVTLSEDIRRALEPKT